MPPECQWFAASLTPWLFLFLQSPAAALWPPREARTPCRKKQIDPPPAILNVKSPSGGEPRRWKMLCRSSTVRPAVIVRYLVPGR